MNRVFLKAGRERSLLRRHPWVFSGAVARVEGAPQSGETVDVCGADGAFLARGAWSPQSQIRVRAWSFDPARPVDGAFVGERIACAAAARPDLLATRDGAGRVVNAESDGLPGVVVDRYGAWCVVQLLSAGAECWRDAIADSLLGLEGCEGVYERSDTDARAKEGLEQRCGVLRGREPVALIDIVEDGCRYRVDVRSGHKTGFYLDQRDNRRRAGAWVQDRELLNCFCYTGAFGIAALSSGAGRVVNLDSSAPALAQAEAHASLNGIGSGRTEHVCGDAFTVLRSWRAAGRRFGAIVLDPPKFVDSQAKLAAGCRGYKDINMLAFQLLEPGGVLVSFSCSGLVGTELFQKVVADAALDAGREAVVVERLSQAADHPVALPFPEGLYLKGLVCRVG